MSIGEMVASGVEFQGDDIRVKIWSQTREKYIFDENLNEIPVDSPEICERNVKYIYTYKGKLVIELDEE